MGKYFEVDVKARPGREQDFERLRAAIASRMSSEPWHWRGFATPEEREQLEAVSIGAEETLDEARRAWPRVDLDPATERAAARWWSRAPWIAVSSPLDVGPTVRAGAVAVASAVNPWSVLTFRDARTDACRLSGPDGGDREEEIWSCLSELDELCEKVRTSVPTAATMETWEIVPVVERVYDEVVKGDRDLLAPEALDFWLEEQPGGAIYRAAVVGTRWAILRWQLFWASHGHGVLYGG